MYKIMFVFSVFLLLPWRIFSAGNEWYKDIDPALRLLKQQVLKDILAGRANEQEAIHYAAVMKEDGSWPDIDYADKTRGGWPVNDHLLRLNNMTIAYKTAGGGLAGDQNLEKKIIAGLDFWVKNDFICPNWWYPQIGVPKALAPVMLLMEDKLSVIQLQSGIKILDRAKIGMTGQNKVWLSGNVIYRSLLTGDTAAVLAAVKAIQQEIVVSEGEGIQPDYSFHQHGTQQQFGNYGSAYAADMLKWAGIFQNTPFQFDAAKIAILRNYLLQGMRWIIWKHKMDISACGRQLFPGAQSEKANGIERITNKMPGVDAAYKEQYLSALNDFEGNNHFWKSDMTVHRRNNFYASVKMSSSRVGGAESCNEENIQGYHLGDGATYFYQSNEEYTDIFPYWDWKMIPGTTAFHDAVPLPVLSCSGYNIASDFVGGASDGRDGIATLSYTRDSLYAQKAWFFFDDAVICLGAGIHSNMEKEIRTTVNQSFLHGTIRLKQSGATHSLAATQPQVFENTNWVLHDNWGYFFPGKATIELSDTTQAGSWHQVLKRMADSTIHAGIFTLWLNHRNRRADDHYAYYVFPGATEQNIDPRGAAFDVLVNTAVLQAVENKQAKKAGFVFMEPAEAATKTFGKISAGKPCVLMIEQQMAAQHISIADPSHHQTSIVIGLPGKKNCSTATVAYDKIQKRTFLSIDLPQGPEAGKTVMLTVD
jgi:chondroitin AC lyase